MNKHQKYYEISRDNYLEIWDRNRLVEQKASGGLGVTGIVIAVTLNLISEAMFNIWFFIPASLFAITVVAGMRVLIPLTWDLSPSGRVYNELLEEGESQEEALHAVATVYALSAESNGNTVDKKADYLRIELIALILAIITLAIVLTLGD